MRFAQHPDVRRNAGVVEHVERQSDDRLEPVVFDDPAADIALALTRIAGEERRAVMHFSDAAAVRRRAFHFAQQIDEEHQLAVAGARDEAEFRGRRRG